jgi:NAD(P)-dependent dehydrogenase (short-subunit alcohol dehydrogenase family)
MREQGGGNIINISSTGGLRAGGLPIYGVTKAALIMLTQNMAREWGQYKIRVNAIAPGLTQTRFSEMLWKEPARGESAAKRTALGRLGHPDDIARVALFLASDLAQYITGETIIVDGGSMVGSPFAS